jgi:hypothetical protein
MRSARALERLGRRWGPEALGGVLLVEAIRQDSAPRGVRVAERRPVRLLDGVPQAGAQPAWRRLPGEGDDG